MKKVLLMATVLVASLSANAQKQYFPTAGDYGLSINATPFLGYAGNLFSGAAGAPNFSDISGTPVGITARYFTADDRALAGTLFLGINSGSTFDAATGKVETKTSQTTIGVAAAYEYKRMKGDRIMATYGPMVRIISTGGNNVEVINGNDATQNTKTEGGGTLSLGLGGTAGVEYFFTPFMSLGGNFNLGLVLNSTSDTETTAGGTTTTTKGGSNFGFGNNSVQGNLNFNIYF